MTLEKSVSVYVHCEPESVSLIATTPDLVPVSSFRDGRRLHCF